MVSATIAFSAMPILLSISFESSLLIVNLTMMYVNLETYSGVDLGLQQVGYSSKRQRVWPESNGIKP